MALVTYGPTMGDGNMGNIVGDAWGYVKKNPLVLVPPLFVAQKTLQAVPSLVRTARNEVQATIQPFRPQQPTGGVDALTSALQLGSGGGAPGGESVLSSSLPIILGAGALGLVLILALGRKKKKP